ncbi:hypothetical protein C8Q80DRAFT_102492 [Daedaleopsis nitida]|nr:hypothetical protein C8Q80DRAFT_102492 [Daedaleopsis nitida]
MRVLSIRFWVVLESAWYSMVLSPTSGLTGTEAGSRIRNRKSLTNIKDLSLLRRVNRSHKSGRMCRTYAASSIPLQCLLSLAPQTGTMHTCLIAAAVVSPSAVHF